MNLFTKYENIENEEIFETILTHREVDIKKIISPANFKSEEFKQNLDEIVFIIDGFAKLEIENEIIYLKKGENIFIPKNAKHRILDTSKEPLCIWLGVYIK